MSDTKLIQLVLDKVSALDKKVDSLDKKVDSLDKKFDKRIDELDEKLTKRLDTIGLNLARLEDDSPTIDEFDALEARVTKLENRAVPN